MQTLRKLLVAGAALALCASVQAQSKQATKAEAEAWVKNAVAYYKTNGREKSLAEWNNKSGPFVKGDLYIFASDFAGKNLAHGVNEKLVGKDLAALKDVDGKSFVVEYVERAKSGKSGWTDYKWPNPVTKEVEAKTTYCEPVDNIAVCAGVYK